MIAPAFAHVLADPRLTPEAVRLVLYVASLGEGKHEVDADTLRMLLGCKGDKPVYAARDRAVRLGYLECTRGGGGQGNWYRWVAPQGGSAEVGESDSPPGADQVGQATPGTPPPAGSDSPPRADQGDRLAPQGGSGTPQDTPLGERGGTTGGGEGDAVQVGEQPTTPESLDLVVTGGPGGGEPPESDPPPEAPRARRERSPPKRPLPADWAPSDGHRDRGRSEGVDVEREAERMRNWAAADGKRKVDWDRTFTNWLMKAAEEGRGRGARGGGGRRVVDEQQHAAASTWTGFNR